MFCPNCGKEINNDSKYCLYCGHKFEIKDEIYSHSYYKDSYKKSHTDSKKEFSFSEYFLKGIIAMIIFFIGCLMILFVKNYLIPDIFNFDKIKYDKYVENPSLIPELTQPETMNGLIDNLKDVQDFLALYLKVSDDDMETKLETFDNYRKELLKLQNFSNTNILNGDVRYKTPHDKKEFNSIKKQYEKTLSKVGLTIEADENYSKYHLAEDNRFTYKKFGKYLPSDVNNYLKLRAKHYKNCICKDELIIPPYALAKRIGDYETFMNANKEFRYINEVRDLLFSYTLMYTFTTDRTKPAYKNNFTKSDKKFLSQYKYSQLNELFSHLATSANGVSENQFDKMYPYEYEKDLSSIKPDHSDLTDIFSIVRKNIMQLKSDENFQYTYISSTGTWAKYDPAKPLKKGDVILAMTDDGYDVYDYKYKRTNQSIQPEKDAVFFIKNDQLFVYSAKHLQIQCLENSYGSFSFRTLSVKSIKKIFPDILIINIDTFGEYSVQVDKPAGSKTYMLISTSGGNYEGYRLTGDIEPGELGNIFTVSDNRAQVNWTPMDSNEGDSYHIYFITQQESGSEENSEQTSVNVN